MSSEIRKYELKARAASQQETRARIAAAASELHFEKGVARTTVAEIARRSGVTRVTVYSHFPDLTHLLPACSAHYEEQHPAPDFGPAFALEPWEQRVEAVLGLLYGWYAEVSPMFSKLFADRVTVPELDAFLSQGIDELETSIVGELAADLGAAESAEVLRVAVHFWTWRRLSLDGLEPGAAAALMARAVAATRAASDASGAPMSRR